LIASFAIFFIFSTQALCHTNFGNPFSLAHDSPFFEFKKYFANINLFLEKYKFKKYL